MANTGEKELSHKEWDKKVLKARKSGYKRDFGKLKHARISSFELLGLAMFGNAQIAH